MDQKIEKGLCQCGCGGKTSIVKYDRPSREWVKGQPIRFIVGHSSYGPLNPNWKGGKRLDPRGYIHIWKPDHPRADSQGYIMEHILIAEKVLGKPLPNGAVVHHANENRSDNRKENLVICENSAYHELLHQRMRALKACSHAKWRKCWICKEYDDPNNLYINSYNHVYHKKCQYEYDRLRRQIREGI